MLTEDQLQQHDTGTEKSSTPGKEESATAEDGPWLFTLDMPSYLPVMQHSTDRELRKKMYQAHLKRASEFSTDLKDYDSAQLPLPLICIA